MAYKLGIIGTNWITKQFVQAAHESGQYALTAVYSRHEDTGQQFAQTFNVDAVYTDLESFYTSGINVVYIASPNSVHFEQVKAAISHDIHVIVEKSAFSNPTEYAAVLELLHDHPAVRLFEAARHIQQANFKIIEKQVAKMEKISGATFVYEKYSSRFDDYLAGNEPNVLSRRFSAGALTDLGVYPIYAAIKLFGAPKQSHYFATPLRNGADGRGIAILRYKNFDVTIEFGKGSNSHLTSEILGRRDTLVIGDIAEVLNVTYYDDGGTAHQLSQEPLSNPMIAEVVKFADMMTNPNETVEAYQELLTLSRTVNQVLFDLRQDAGIVFTADEQ
ncbi:Gfo/Idh/MocA family oxidoreductase [Weissella paramesenteroides]|uniref:Gfo/Idh/MocA family protein n=1 Tax=Weissella paramesenteroides TaxID=1249 RepID=UPI0023A9E908|nr:Gfo/Idh/MocA family oxidoreductase [Weissella paramesenteroides]WEA53552.1 Gfo/Idh/MocA family oxidoreductase [Weissella paramesenteroides]